jgi:hypothetical protein
MERWEGGGGIGGHFWASFLGADFGCTDTINLPNIAVGVKEIFGGIFETLRFEAGMREAANDDGDLHFEVRQVASKATTPPKKNTVQIMLRGLPEGRSNTRIQSSPFGATAPRRRGYCCQTIPNAIVHVLALRTSYASAGELKRY